MDRGGWQATMHGVAKSQIQLSESKLCFFFFFFFPVVMYGCERWTIIKTENWRIWRCPQTVVLKKTLESPLDYKIIKSANPKGSQPWIFIGRNDAEAEDITLYLFILFYFLTLQCCIGFAIYKNESATCVPRPEPSSLLPPHNIPLGHPSPADAKSFRKRPSFWERLRAGG